MRSTNGDVFSLVNPALNQTSVQEATPEPSRRVVAVKRNSNSYGDSRDVDLLMLANGTILTVADAYNQITSRPFTLHVNGRFLIPVVRGESWSFLPLSSQRVDELLCLPEIEELSRLEGRNK